MTKQDLTKKLNDVIDHTLSLKWDSIDAVLGDDLRGMEDKPTEASHG